MSYEVRIVVVDRGNIKEGDCPSEVFSVKLEEHHYKDQAIFRLGCIVTTLALEKKE